MVGAEEKSLQLLILAAKPALKTAQVELSQPKLDIFEVLRSLLLAGCQENMTWEEVANAAGNPEYAREATHEEERRLISILEELTEKEDKALYPLAELVLAHANALNQLERNGEAILLWNALEHVFAGQEWEYQLAFCLLSRGNVRSCLGEHAEAVNDFRRAEPILAREGQDLNLAICRLNCAINLVSLGRHKEALPMYEKAETQFLSQGCEVEAAHCRKDRAATLVKLGSHTEALDDYEQAELLLSRHSRDIDVAYCQGDQAFLLQKMGRHAEALTKCDRAEPVFAQRSLVLDVATCQMNRAAALAGLGRFEEALAACDLAEPVFEQQGRDIMLAACLVNRAQALQHFGRYTEAIAVCDRAEVIFINHNLEVEMARCRSNRAAALRRLGRNTQVELDCEWSVKVFARHGLDYDEAVCQRNRSALLELLDRHGEALEALNAAELIFTRLGRDLDVAGCQGNRAVLMWKMGRYMEAIGACDQAEPVFARYGRGSDVALCQMNRASALQELDQHGKAVKAFEQIDHRHLRDDTVWAYYWGLALALWNTNKQDRAFAQFDMGRRALRKARRTSGVDDTWLEFVASRQGLIREAVSYSLASGRHQLAFEAIQDGKAVILGDLRQGLSQTVPTDDEVIATRTNLGRWLHSEQNRCPSAAVEPETRSRAHHYFKTWNIARNRTTLNQAPEPDIITFEEIQRALPDDWALLDFWVLDNEQIKVFLVTRGGMSVETLRIPVEDTEVQRALRDLESWHETAEAGRDDALYLFDELLFSPLRFKLRGIKGLYLVPHSYLNLIPLHACCPEQGRSLGDEFAVAYLPSASLLPQLPPLRLNGAMLTFANPDQGDPNRTLPFSEWEAEQLRTRLNLPRHQVWIGREATFDKTAAWQTTPIVHFSCHGFGHPRFAPLSHLRLADDVLLAHDVVYRQPPLPDGSLAILNGCQTGVRDWRAVDEGLGLMSAFLLRGASLVLSTQWSVHDLCAAEMVTTFLTELVTKKTSPTEALRAAQRRVRQITRSEVEARCQELLTRMFPSDDRPHEAAKVSLTAMRACLRGGNRTGAKHYAQQAAAAFRSAGLRSQADMAESLLDANDPASKTSRNMGEPMYDHPIYWAAFQLVGRVTN